MSHPRTLPRLAAVHVVHPGAYMQCTSYLLVGPEGSVLIDPGSGCEEDALLANIAAVGVALPDVKAILLTHCHADHALGAGRIRARGPRILASPQNAAKLRTADRESWGEHPDLIPRTPVDEELADGETVRLAGLDILCVATPGHTAGCMSFVVAAEAGRPAFTGDVVCANGQPGWAGGPDFSVERTLASIDRLLALNLDQAFWGHGGPLLDPAAWLRGAAALGRANRWDAQTAYSFQRVPEKLRDQLGAPKEKPS